MSARDMGWPPPEPDIEGMRMPVRCRWCSHVHDASQVEVEARYADCSVWRCPGCGTQVDDRPIAWGGSAIPISADRP